jgi:dihydroxyacetone kinase
MAAAMEKEADELGRIDAVAGDGDHGRGMVKGTKAAADAARSALGDKPGPGAVLVDAGEAWAAQAGGTSGVLWGAALGALGRRVGNATAPSPEDVAHGVRDAYDALVRLGGAEPGDKTMLDAIDPFAATLAEQVAEGDGLAPAWIAACRAAQEAAEATASMRPRVGRARPLAERSVGTPDAGAVSFALCVRAVGTAMEGAADE